MVVRGQHEGAVDSCGDCCCAGRTDAGYNGPHQGAAKFEQLDWVIFRTRSGVRTLQEFKKGSQVAFKGKLKLFKGAVHNTHCN